MSIVARWIAGAIVVALYSGVVYFQGRSNGYEAGSKEWRVASQQAAERFAEAIQDQQATLTTEDRDRSTERRQTQRLQEDLHDALATPEGLAWGDTPLPGDVRVPVNAARHPAVPRDPVQPD